MESRVSLPRKASFGQLIGGKQGFSGGLISRKLIGGAIRGNVDRLGPQQTQERAVAAAETREKHKLYKKQYIRLRSRSTSLFYKTLLSGSFDKKCPPTPRWDTA